MYIAHGSSVIYIMVTLDGQISHAVVLLQHIQVQVEIDTIS